MDQIKGALQSKAVWGSLISIASMLIATATGYVIPPEEQGKLAGNLLDLTAFAGSVYAIYGRVIATHKIVQVAPVKKDESFE